MPGAVSTLRRENLRAQAFVRDARAFRSDGLRGRVCQIAHRLPPDGRIGIQKPVDRIHTPISWCGSPDGAMTIAGMTNDDLVRGARPRVRFQGAPLRITF